MNKKEDTSMDALNRRASKVERFVNWVVDFLFIVWGGFFLIMFGVGGLLWDLYRVDIGGDVAGVVILLGWWFLYYFILELAFGRTVGKFITGTKVVNREGEKPSAGKIALRTLIRFVPFEALSGFRISNEESTWARGCWHDDWSDTVVVKTR